MPNTTPSEYQEQLRLIVWLKSQNLRFHHSPNETYTRSHATKAKNKAMGVSSGFPDLVVLVPGHGAVFVELKRVKGSKTSETQKEWIAALTSVGCPARVCLGATEAIEFLKGLL